MDEFHENQRESQLQLRKSLRQTIDQKYENILHSLQNKNKLKPINDKKRIEML